MTKTTKPYNVQSIGAIIALVMMPIKSRFYIAIRTVVRFFNYPIFNCLLQTSMRQPSMSFKSSIVFLNLSKIGFILSSPFLHVKTNVFGILFCSISSRSLSYYFWMFESPFPGAYIRFLSNPRQFFIAFSSINPVPRAILFNVFSIPTTHISSMFSSFLFDIHGVILT